MCICIAIVIAFVAYTVRMARAAAEPKFIERGVLTGEKLNYMLSVLAYSSKRTTRGNGISVRKIRRVLYRAYRAAYLRAARGDGQTCEVTFVNEFYRIAESLDGAASAARRFRALPHVNGVPRLYSLCEWMVKSHGGVLDEQSVRAAVEGYTAETPLRYAELCALPDMLMLSLCEYLAIYAQKIMRMGERIDAGVADARAGRIDVRMRAYNSYMYGILSKEDLPLPQDADIYEHRRKFAVRESAYNAAVQAAVGSLHRLRAYCTDPFLCSLSPVYAYLQENDQTFHTLSPATQRMYLSRIAAMAKKQKSPEQQVASEILFRAKREEKDMAHCLLRPPLRKRAQIRFAVCSLIAVAAAAVGYAFVLPKWSVAYVLVALPVFAFAVYAVLQRIANRAVSCRVLPALAPEALSAEKHATVLLCPCYAADTADIERAFRHLQTVAAANPEPVFSYCLLLDYAASQTPNADTDAANNAFVRDRYASVEQGLRKRMCVLVRSRQRAGDKLYRGYEKKRGAVLDFNRFVLSGEGDFMLRLGDRPAAKYAVTIDDDTLINDAVTLVCTKAHPYAEDSALLSLRCKSTAMFTAFARLFAGEAGPGRYRTQASDLYGDLFGVGNFTGKGIYDIALFQERLDGLFPDERILSHDYIEGAAAGCLNSSVCAAEDVPQSFSQNLTRDIRWLRGDWQLLPYVLPHCKNKAGEKIRSPLPVAARFSVAVNLLLSLLPIAQLLVLTLSLFSGASAATWVLAFLPQLLRIVLALPALFRYPRQFAAEIARCVLDIVWLPTVAAYKLCAVAVTLYRLAVHKKLLEWQVFAHAKGKTSFLPNAVAAIVFAATAAIFARSPLFYVLAALFLAAYPVNALLSREKKTAKPSDALLSRLSDTAKQTFAYFAAQEDAYALPCDCYQEDNGLGWCARTSPTNIGMSLVAYAAAYELGIITKERLLSFGEKMIMQAEKCEKWHGNLYNWYDCKTRRVLPRRFVSTVDSGNFVASLALFSTYATGGLYDRTRALIDNTDLGKLYDAKRGLLYIGYDDESKSYTDNHYDLWGSESTLTYLTACAYGKIPKEGYYNLDRTGVRYGRHSTAYSWTGGMFEYLLTRLFVSPQSHTLAHNAMAGAVKAHVRFGAKREQGLWGVSECRYCETDENGGNLYRAFGVPAIAHATVPLHPPVAPYASFLALPYCGERVFLRNYNALCAYGATGEYGFYDAVDAGTPVRSYMSHHQGMLLGALCNAVKRDCFATRLSALPEWRAAALLTGEAPITHARRKKVYRTVPASPPVPDEKMYIGKCARLSAVAAEDGAYIEYGGKRLVQNVRVSAEDEKTCDLLRGDFYARESAVWQRRESAFISSCAWSVLPSPLGAGLHVAYRNTSRHSRTVRFTVSADPVLAPVCDYESHPVYSRLFLRAERSDTGMTVRRGGDAVSAVLSLYGADDATYITDKCTLYGRGRRTDSARGGNPVMAATFSRTLRAGEQCEFSCGFLVAEHEDKAAYAARLFASSDCILRQTGAVASLARGVSAYARKTARKLNDGVLGAVAAEGIDASKPTVAVETDTVSQEDLRAMLSDLRLLYESGFAFTVVLFTKRKIGATLRSTDTERLLSQTGLRAAAEGKGGVTVLAADEKTYAVLTAHMTGEERRHARAVKSGNKKKNGTAAYSSLQAEQDKKACKKMLPAVVKSGGIGGFTADNAYVLPNAETPAPWCNILSNGEIGCVIGESGGGFTFLSNARQYKITEWTNDPVCDPVSEWAAIDTGNELWSVTRRPFGKGAYAAVHGLGYSVFYSVYRGIATVMTVYISRADDAKVLQLHIENKTDAPVSVQAMFAVRPVLGDFARNTRPSLTARTTENGLHMESAVFGCEAYLCCDRPFSPFGAYERDGKAQIYDDLTRDLPFWGVKTPVSLAAGEDATVRFTLSAHETKELSPDALERARLFYKRLPRITFDGEYGYLTEWLPYQVYNSRFTGRTGFYQVSGAYGFRDQLQDGLALLYCDPALVREHILDCARHQFKEGDVQHWWHPPAVGVRTHVCDDRLWLVYATCAYISHTGDKEILDENVPFLCDVPISPQDASVYTAANFSGMRASLYEHCLRAIRVSCDFGENGLVRMRGGDWNDAMDKVGEHGLGTSVWCSMFLYAVIDMFLPYVPDTDMREKLQAVCAALSDAVKNAYGDGRFYRAYTDDGTVLGAPSSPACKIDLLTQSFATLTDIGTSEQQAKALDSAYALLCDPAQKLVKLFDPPFTSPQGVGYIGAYPEGVRENGGQYTQAAVWYVYALFKAGEHKRANELLRWLSPFRRSDTPQKAQVYAVEPYVSAADVYAGELAGKGGWTWYTGSASWLYKLLVEQYAGITVVGDVLRFSPNLPDDTPELNVKIRYEGNELTVKIVNSPAAHGAWRVRIGSVVYNTASLKLTPGLVGKNISLIRLPK